MKRVVTCTFVVCLLAGGFSSCHLEPLPPPEPTLPPITQTGENTFGCYVNGELWLPKASWMGWTPTFEYRNNRVAITAERSGHDPYSYFHIYFEKVFRDTTFAIHNYSDPTGYQSFTFNESYSNPTVITDYYPLAANSGELHIIRLDTINKIVAGTFHFVAVDTLTGDSVRIEDGRFDFHYY